MTYRPNIEAQRVRSLRCLAGVALACLASGHAVAMLWLVGRALGKAAGRPQGPNLGPRFLELLLAGEFPSAWPCLDPVAVFVAWAVVTIAAPALAGALAAIAAAHGRPPLRASGSSRRSGVADEAPTQDCP